MTERRTAHDAGTGLVFNRREPRSGGEKWHQGGGSRHPNEHTLQFSRQTGIVVPNPKCLRRESLAERELKAMALPGDDNYQGLDDAQAARNWETPFGACMPPEEYGVAWGMVKVFGMAKWKILNGEDRACMADLRPIKKRGNDLNQDRSTRSWRSPFLPSLPPHLSPLRQTCIRRRRLIQSYRHVDTPVQGRSSRRPFPQGGLLKVLVRQIEPTYFSRPHPKVACCMRGMQRSGVASGACGDCLFIGTDSDIRIVYHMPPCGLLVPILLI
ncbi:hypothetical protein BKA70DRAFT_1410196 [Coprinopsis sp. MPI-PUGE-AT-0042]|nr:hypothetical protein BKA70DRAFT_1410196 [Coprinopsis sp. MPI-PUGE-AT-0042]